MFNLSIFNQIIILGQTGDIPEVACPAVVTFYHTVGTEWMASILAIVAFLLALIKFINRKHLKYKNTPYVLLGFSTFLILVSFIHNPQGQCNPTALYRYENLRAILWYGTLILLVTFILWLILATVNIILRKLKENSATAFTKIAIIVTYFISVIWTFSFIWWKFFSD